MGRIGPLDVVAPAEFRERTSLALSSRSGSTLLVDQAYDNYCALRSPIAAKILYDRLRDYRQAHGGEWSRCDRNAVSGGLLEHLQNVTAPGALSAEQALALDKKAAARIEAEEIRTPASACFISWPASRSRWTPRPWPPTAPAPSVVPSAPA